MRVVGDGTLVPGKGAPSDSVPTDQEAADGFM